MKIPRVAAIHDLSGLGKCSLTAAIPVLSAMGVQACPLATAVLSNQTGFKSYAWADLSAHMHSFVSQWQEHKITFDGIFTGFIWNAAQVKEIRGLCASLRQPSTLLMVDPVLGDNGKRYPVFQEDMVPAMSALVEDAHIITPNVTEACLLTGFGYNETQEALREGNLAPLWSMAEKLSGAGARTVVITGAASKGFIHTLGVEAGNGRHIAVNNRQIGEGYSGTGDLFASVLCGGLVKSWPLQQTMELAATFLEAAIADAHTMGTDPKEGAAFEKHLYRLFEKSHETEKGGEPHGL